MIELVAPEDLTNDQLMLAVTLSHVCMAIVFLKDSGIENNLNVDEAIGLLEPLIRAKCTSDHDFDELMRVARNQISNKNHTLN